MLRDLRGRLERDAAGRLRGQLTAQLGDRPASGLRITLTPAVESGVVASTVTLEVQGEAAPAELLAPFVPGFSAVGTRARFEGVVQWTLDVAQPRGRLQGRIHSADLASLMPTSSPHILRGEAAVEIAEFAWRGDRLQRLTGAISSNGAAMSRSLIDAMTSKTGFQCPQASDGVPAVDDPSLAALDQLAVRFQLSDEGVTFWGQCPSTDGAHANCIAVSGKRPLLIAPPFYNWHLGVLVQTLAGPGAAWLPATREAVDMAGRLPLPVK